jgi:hypothetical protein
MITIKTIEPVGANNNVHDLQAERQRRVARRMALQTIKLLYAYPTLYRLTPCSTLPATRYT